MSINVTDFAGVNDIRVWMRKPFSINGRLCATDGASAFMSKEESDLPAPETTAVEKISEYFDMAAKAGFSPAPEFIFPEKHDCTLCKGTGKSEFTSCPECDGEGEATAETDYNTYEVLCRTCDGSGKVEERKPTETCHSCEGSGKRWDENDRMQIEGIPFDMHPDLIGRIAGEPELQIALIDSNKISRCIAFKCGDGIGLVMGMRDKK